MIGKINVGCRTASEKKKKQHFGIQFSLSLTIWTWLLMHPATQYTEGITCKSHRQCVFVSQMYEAKKCCSHFTAAESMHRVNWQACRRTAQELRGWQWNWIHLFFHPLSAVRWVGKRLTGKVLYQRSFCLGCMAGVLLEAQRSSEMLPTCSAERWQLASVGGGYFSQVGNRGNQELTASNSHYCIFQDSAGTYS